MCHLIVNNKIHYIKTIAVFRLLACFSKCKFEMYIQDIISLHSTKLDKINLHACVYGDMKLNSVESASLKTNWTISQQTYYHLLNQP